jgi:hypothetical protein
MKIILSEEQIKHILNKRLLAENPEDVAATAADGSVDAAVSTPGDPLSQISNATNRMRSMVAAINGNQNPYSDVEYTNAEDPMPNGPMAYADQKRLEYNNSIGINQDWLRVVQQTYNDFKGPLFHGQYSQSGFKKYNGSTARADCTGFICAALRNAGYKVPNNDSRGMVGGSSFTNQISGGFTRVNWNKNAYGTINGKPLPAGTILCYPGHGMIVGEYNPSTKKLKGYDYGHNRHDENNPVNMEKIYTVAWIPKGGGNA